MSNKVPQIRFNGYSDAWEDRKLSDIADRFDNLRVPITASDRKPGDTPYYGANGIQDYVEGFTHNGEFILVAEDGANDLKNYPVQYVNGKVWVNNHAHVLQGKKTITDNKFLMNAIKNFKIEPFLVGGGRAKLNADVMMKLNILLPTFVEQEKIGSLFSLLDKTIALHQRKLDLLKEEKKGYLQKMFPKNGAKVPELRFAGFADDWEERKLGDTETHFTDGNYGESYPSAKDMSDKANGIPFLRGSDFSNGYLDSSNANYIKPEKHAELTSGHIKQDDIVLVVRGSLGTLGYATKENEGWNINSQLAILRTNKSEISGMFLIQYLLGSKGQKEIFSRNTGTALKQLPIKQLKDIPVPVPTLLEQQKIGNFFKELDSTIALHQRKLDLLKEQKKGFLQKMFV
ncbi:Type I restriction-modification system, specificity subunit S (plasmid) [Pediococcus damnosus]|uniref:Type I restriction-modification system, specificity subunit S n=1 Tax=Pediococcus damnosus TaxID=51663 RepID=A0ABM6A7P1_9LACO|nr:restriction endonuclease subunit S [Pediococcus damnosus]AMV68384.1 Type I restriction-modification system, specificity subunit S [Pediococcus damnosus]